MSVFAEFFAALPLSVAVVLVVLRYAPAALVTLVAGVVAAVTRHRERGERALDVLRLLHECPRKPHVIRDRE